METNSAIGALAALAQETRLAVFRLLVQAGSDGLSVGEIGEAVGASGATLSFHLKELVNAGLILPRQEGRFIYYGANYDHMNELLAFLTDNCCAGSAAKCAPATGAACQPAGTAKSKPKQNRRPRVVATRRAQARQL